MLKVVDPVRPRKVVTSGAEPLSTQSASMVSDTTNRLVVHLIGHHLGTVIQSSHTAHQRFSLIWGCTPHTPKRYIIKIPSRGTKEKGA